MPHSTNGRSTTCWRKARGRRPSRASTPGGAGGRSDSQLSDPIAIEAVEGPLADERLRAVADLYGRADDKYRSVEYLRHLLADGPAGPALHVFAHAGDAIAHCCVVPMPARTGDRRLRSGKVEAFFVEERFREATVDERPLAIALLDRLYRFAAERDIEVLHAYATRELGVLHRLLGFRALSVGEPSLVRVTGGATLGRGARALAAGQAVVLAGGAVLARTGARAETATVRLLEEGDADLVETPPAGPARWTVAGQDLWSWYRDSDLLRVVEIGGRRGSRTLVQLHGPGNGLLLVAWRAPRPTLAAGVLALRACARLARSSGAPTLRFQPWNSPGGDGALRGAARLMALVRRHDLTTLYVRASDPDLVQPGSVELTPFFYLTF